MAKIKSSVIVRVTMAIEVAVQLVGQINEEAKADPKRTAKLFLRLRRLIRGLPSSQHLLPQFQTNLVRWPRTWQNGDYKAARIQMVLLIRKLRRYRDDWGGGALALVPPTSAANLGVSARATAAIEIGVELIGQLNEGAKADMALCARLFARLRLLIRSLPPSQHLSTEFERSMAPWPRIWEANEYKAARYRMVLLIRKLRAYRDDWGSGGVQALVLPIAPKMSPTAVPVNS